MLSRFLKKIKNKKTGIRKLPFSQTSDLSPCGILPWKSPTYLGAIEWTLSARPHSSPVSQSLSPQPHCRLPSLQPYTTKHYSTSVAQEPLSRIQVPGFCETSESRLANGSCSSHARRLPSQPIPRNVDACRVSLNVRPEVEPRQVSLRFALLAILGDNNTAALATLMLRPAHPNTGVQQETPCS